MTFNELNLTTYISNVIEQLGYKEATEIQSLSIPIIRSGKDMVGLSQTGSGKTFAFAIPAIEMADADTRRPQALIICPTRELATQATEEIRRLLDPAAYIRVVPIFGGSNMERQIISLKKNAQIVVGTPGRLMDHLRRRTLKLDQLKMLILDEADEMLNMGFREDIETILKSVKTDHQTVMFSATMPDSIMALTKNYMKDPTVIQPPRSNAASNFIKQYYTTCARSAKLDTLKTLLDQHHKDLSIIFCNTKVMVDELQKELSSSGIMAVGLHGDYRQNDRKKVMDRFRKQTNGILIATDVAARGIDIKGISMVFNYDLPNDNEYYTHRIGRTARAGREGSAITILNTKAQLRRMVEMAFETENNIEELTTPHTVSMQLMDNDTSKRGRGGKGGNRNGNRSRSSAPRTNSDREHTDRKPRKYNSDKPNYSKKPSDRNDREKSGRDRNDRNRPNRDTKGRNDNKDSKSPRKYNDRKRDDSKGNARKYDRDDRKSTNSNKPKSKKIYY